MKTSEFLNTLSAYPQADQIDEASNYAQDKAYDYAKSLDPDAVVTVEDGEVYVKWSVKDSEFEQNVQVTFDEAFGEKIFEMGFREQIEVNFTDDNCNFVEVLGAETIDQAVTAADEFLQSEAAKAEDQSSEQIHIVPMCVKNGGRFYGDSTPANGRVTFNVG